MGDDDEGHVGRWLGHGMEQRLEGLHAAGRGADADDEGAVLRCCHDRMLLQAGKSGAPASRGGL
jgi:hypothetical protein